MVGLILVLGFSLLGMYAAWLHHRGQRRMEAVDERTLREMDPRHRAQKIEDTRQEWS